MKIIIKESIETKSIDFLEPVLITDASEQCLGKQKPSEVIDLMYLLPNYQDLSLKKQFDFEKAEYLIKKSIKEN